MGELDGLVDVVLLLVSVGAATEAESPQRRIVRSPLQITHYQPQIRLGRGGEERGNLGGLKINFEEGGRGVEFVVGVVGDLTGMVE